MRTTALGRNRSRQPAAVGVSLFPFLAVLICTMGALILLLVVIARQARLQAAQVAASGAAEKQDDLRAELEVVRWRIEQLQQSRQKTEAQLAEARLSLGHVEDHARRLRDQLARLEAAWDELERVGSDDSRQRGRLEAELARLKAEIAEAQQRLADARRAAAERRRSYAVVPYQGPNETYRRPIYIECRQETIVLQPEGIVLTEDDFEGPLGPGNPLAAAVRASREYLLEQGGFDPKGPGEPYPLLLVRPGGIAAYYAARAAMKSWASEFGYELIGEDWKLEFPAPDAQLAEVVRRAVDTARVRQQRLAAAAPRHYGDPRRAKYRAAPTRGGIVRDGGWPGGVDSGTQRPKPGGPRSEQQGQAGGDRGAAMRIGEWQPGGKAKTDSAAAGSVGRHVESLANSRGQDWALPDAARGSVPITRPIRVECHADRLIIVPEKGLRGGKTIRLALRTEDSVDEFISALWEHMQSWGIAGKGMYWRPVLHVYVAADAQRRFAELNTLLGGSGLAVEEKDEG